VTEESIDHLPLDEMRTQALERAEDLGCSNAELRIETIRTQTLVLRDGLVETSLDETDVGAGLRVIVDGALGFAATVDLADGAGTQLADDAAELAQATRAAMGTEARAIELAPEPSYGEVSWSSEYRLDPTAVSTAEKVELLQDWSKRLLGSDGVDHVTMLVVSTVEDKYYADLSGTVARQRRVRIFPEIEATSVLDAGGFESMRTLAAPTARGWEYMLGEGWDWEEELAAIPGWLAEKRGAPSVESGEYDLVIDPTNLWLTIHESIGHATELDRAMGYEAAYAGTSFATFDQLGKLQYGSAVMNVTGDRVVPYGLATIGFDDEGVATRSFDIVQSGVLVGYQLDRRIASEQHLGGSNGCAYAQSALYVPIQRMANVSLAHSGTTGPSTEDLISSVSKGIYVVGDKSWSIDMQRHNFQFSGQRFYMIDGGRITGPVKDVAYQSRTTDFWGSMKAVGGEATHYLGGSFHCGKGQPGQVAPVSHGCPSALFENVHVLNAVAESGR
jgi:TldD protein